MVAARAISGRLAAGEGFALVWISTSGVPTLWLRAIKDSVVVRVQRPLCRNTVVRRLVVPQSGRGRKKDKGPRTSSLFSC
jgi:hypothetical protein